MSILGIDIADNSIKVVSMKRRGSRYILDRLLELPFSLEQSTEPILLGRMLGEALQEKGLQNQPAVMTLPHRLCFIKRFSAGDLDLPKGKTHINRNIVERIISLSRQTIAGPSNELTFDLWFGAAKINNRLEQNIDDTILVGAVRDSVVTFCRDLATAGGIKLHSLELRSVASINGLLFNWKKDPRNNIAVVYCESSRAYVAIMDGHGLVALQTIHFDQNDNVFSALHDQIPRIFNTLKLHHGRPKPEHLYLTSHQEPNEESLAVLQQKLSMPVTLCKAGAGIRFAGASEKIPNKVDYVPAIGAALDGLSSSVVWFDFLHPHGRHIEKKKFSWTPLIAAVVTLILVGGGLWLSILDQKMAHLRQLKGQISQLEPELNNIMQSKQTWELFSSYLPAEMNGSRVEYLRILYEINQLMPETRDAFIANLTLTQSIPPGSDNKQVVVTVRANQAELGTQLINDLNQSSRFQDAAQIGPRTRDENDTLYPLSFSVGCNLKTTRSKP